MEITMYKFKEMNLQNATIINGFPSTNIINSIVASYLINTLNLDQICGLDADEFPPVTMVYDSKPKLPARIYASEEAKIVVFLSEFTPYPPMARDIARMVLSFAKESGCSRIVSPEIQVMEEDGFKVLGVGSTEAAREELKKLKLEPLMNGIIPGISGVLLNMGKVQDINVLVPIAQRGKSISDARMAAHIIEFIDELIPTIKIDIEPLLSEAEGLEKHLKGLRKQAAKPEDPYGMYR
ncbi:MAG: proteasome assembly chaperone family protein [Methanosarcinales archaeon]|nr:proteasome assembly chaperone family protein [Methanosarcinales archaeon]